MMRPGRLGGKGTIDRRQHPRMGLVLVGTIVPAAIALVGCGGATAPPAGSPPLVTWVQCIPGGGCYLVPGNSLSNVTTGNEPFACQPIKPHFTPEADDPCGWGADQETPLSP